MTTATRTMTVRDPLAMPDDGKRRWIVEGELRPWSVVVRGEAAVSFPTTSPIPVARLFE